MDPLTYAALGSGLGGLYSAYQGGQALSDANAAMQAATNRSIAESQRQFDIGQQNLAPWLQSGRKALTEQQALLGLGGDTQAAMRGLTSSPGYQFRLQQGQQGLESGLAARGGMGSGKAMQAATEYGQNYASGEYGNRLNQLAQLSGKGQGTASTMAGMGANQASRLSDLWTGAANAQGAMGMQRANLTASSLQGVGNTLGSLYGRR